MKSKKRKGTKSPLKLKSVLKESYSTLKKEPFLYKGYAKLKRYSNHNHQAYYNYDTKKLVFVVTGTHNLSDVVTDAVWATGFLKHTSRYKEAKKALDGALEDIWDLSGGVTVVGHSLGGAIARGIASKNHRIVTYNKASLGDKNRKNEESYRTGWDWASAFSRGSKSIPQRYFLPHGVDNITESYDVDL